MIGKVGSKDPWEDIDRVVGEVVVVREQEDAVLLDIMQDW